MGSLGLNVMRSGGDDAGTRLVSAHPSALIVTKISVELSNDAMLLSPGDIT